MTQITFSSDVNEVSTDSSVDGSIRWHVYEKDSESSPGDKGIYLRREVNSGVLEPEKQIVSIGTDPKIYFLVNEWILLFKFSDRIAKITYTQEEDPVLFDNDFNQSGNASSFAFLDSFVIPTRIVFQASASSLSSLESFARIPAIGEANSSASLISFAEAPPAFMGTNSVPGSSQLLSIVFDSLVKLRIRENASSNSELVGRANVFFAQIAIGGGDISLEGIASGANVILPILNVTAEAIASSSLTSSLDDAGVSPTNITPPEFTDSSVFNVGRTIEVTEGTWDGDPDPTI